MRMSAATSFPRFPLFDSGVGERTEEGNPLYSIAGVNSNTVHAWALVGPGKVIAVANTHLTSNPYGPELVRDGKTLAEVLQNETDTRAARSASPCRWPERPWPNPERRCFWLGISIRLRISTGPKRR